MRRSSAGARFSGLAVDVGNPHLACVDPGLTEATLAALDVAAPVQFDPAQFPDGVNVEVLTAPSDGAVDDARARTRRRRNPLVRNGNRRGRGRGAAPRRR